MKANLRFDAIGSSDLNRYLAQYPDCVPSSLSALDELRYNTIPQTLAQRKADAKSFLEKSEIVSLVDWKLKHGKYRPNLAKLVASNTVDDVREATKEAFEIYESDGTHYDKAVSRIAKLKGVGPATASLVLGCYDPIRVPFFSDELFRYLHWEDTKAGGWDRRIGYTMKEYKELYARMQQMRERLEGGNGETMSAVDVEKMAYALAKEAQNGTVVRTTIEEPKEQEEDDKAIKAPNPKKRKRTKIQKSSRSPSPTTICLRKGPKGSPTHENFGFELDYKAISRASGPRRPRKQRMDHFERMAREDERKAEIMNISTYKQSAMTMMAQDDRVARDLGIPYHKVGIEEYEEWYKKGFRAKPGEFENIPKKEADRITELATGSAFRKGAKD